MDLTDFSASSSTTANLKPQTGSTQEILLVLPEIRMGHLRQNDAVLLGSREQGSKKRVAFHFNGWFTVQFIGSRVVVC